MIELRIREFGLAVVLAAIDSMWAHKWRKDKGYRYCEIEQVLRQPERVEFFIGLDPDNEEPGAAPPRAYLSGSRHGANAPLQGAARDDYQGSGVRLTEGEDGKLRDQNGNEYDDAALGIGAPIPEVSHGG